MSAILLEHVTRTFGDVLAVDDASLRVERGEVVGLVGANGAGKTTLIRVLLGLLAPDAGRVELAGGPPSRETRRQVGYVPQGLGLWPDLTLDEHLALVRDAYGVAEVELDDPGLTAVRTRPIGALPLGLRRRAAFVVARSHDPEVLVLDEPTSGVDPLAREQLWDTIRAVAVAGASVLVTTHYLDEAARCDRVVLMADGRIAAEGTLAELTAGRWTVEVRAPRWQAAWSQLVAAGMDVLPAGRALRVSGADLEAVRAVVGPDANVERVGASLDEVFLQATRS